MFSFWGGNHCVPILGEAPGGPNLAGDQGVPILGEAPGGPNLAGDQGISKFSSTPSIPPNDLKIASSQLFSQQTCPRAVVQKNDVSAACRPALRQCSMWRTTVPR